MPKAAGFEYQGATGMTLTGSTVAANAPWGTPIGDFSEDVTLQSNPSNYFGVYQKRKLLSAWHDPARPGQYTIRVHGKGQPQKFTVTLQPGVAQPPPQPPPVDPPPPPPPPVVVPPPPPPVPVPPSPPATDKPGLHFSSDNMTVAFGGPSLTDNPFFGSAYRGIGKAAVTYKIGKLTHPGLASVGFATSQAIVNAHLGWDNNSFGVHGTGTYTINGSYGHASGVTFADGSTVDMVADFDLKLFWIRADGGAWNGNGSADPIVGSGGLDMSGLADVSLCPAVSLVDQGDYVTGVFSGAGLSAGIPMWGGSWDPPHPTTITITPVITKIPDSASAGTVIATVAVSVSHGDSFSGLLMTSDTGFFAVSGMNIVTARALTPHDDGTHTAMVTAHQGGQTVASWLEVAS